MHPPPLPPATRPPPPPAPIAHAEDTPKGQVGANPQEALFAAIAARREAQEQRMRMIEAGALAVEDPRERRERELKEAASHKKRGRRKLTPPPQEQA